MEARETQTSAAAITLNVLATRQSENRGNIMSYKYVVEVEYKDGSVKSKMFKRNEFDKVNNYHGRMQSAWGKGIKKVVTKKIQKENA